MSKGPKRTRRYPSLGLQQGQPLASRDIGGGVQDVLRRAITKQQAPVSLTAAQALSLTFEEATLGEPTVGASTVDAAFDLRAGLWTGFVRATFQLTDPGDWNAWLTIDGQEVDRRRLPGWLGSSSVLGLQGVFTVKFTGPGPYAVELATDATFTAPLLGGTAWRFPGDAA